MKCLISNYLLCLLLVQYHDSFHLLLIFEASFYEMFDLKEIIYYVFHYLDALLISSLSSLACP